MKAELAYSGLLVKELADQTGLKKHTIDNYLSVRGRMPAADAAVRIAHALGVSVEYLVTGKEFRQSRDISKYIQFRDVLDDLATLPDELLDPIKAMIKTAADFERKKTQADKTT